MGDHYVIAENFYFKKAALWSLERISSSESVEALIRISDMDPSAEIDRLILAHNVVRSKQLVQTLIKFVDHKNSNIKRLVAKALGETGESLAIAPLMKAVKDRDPFVRCNAATSLVKLGERGYLKVLIDLANNIDYDLRIYAIYCLAYLHIDEAVISLIEIYFKDERNAKQGSHEK